jgi:hypothetical protein
MSPGRRLIDYAHFPLADDPRYHGSTTLSTDPRQEDQDVGHRVFRIVEKLNVGSPAPQLWGKPGFAKRVVAV